MDTYVGMEIVRMSLLCLDRQDLPIVEKHQLNLTSFMMECFEV